MPRRRRRQTLPALLIGSVAETTLRMRARHAEARSRRTERGEVVSPVPQVKPRPKRKVERPAVRPSEPRSARVRQTGQAGSRVVVLLVVLALGVPFFTMSGVKPAIAAGTISYGGHIGTGAELYGNCAGSSSRSLAPSDDSQVLEESPTQTSGGASTMEVRTSSGGGRHRALVRFDLPPVPSGCYVSSAELRLPVQSHSGGRTLVAARVASAWSESTVTWSNQPAFVAAGSVSTNSNPNVVAWPVTSLVSDMYSSGNYGFAIRDANESSGAARQQFATKESSVGPTLVLNFGSGYGTSVSVTTTSPVPAGHSVVLSFAMGDATGPLAATDSAGNSYTVDADAAYTGNVRSAVFSAHNVDPLPAGSTITVTHPETGSRALSANQFAGLDAAAVDGSNAAAGSGTSVDSGAVTPTTSDSLLVGAFGIAGDATFSAGSGFTLMPGLVAPGQGQLATQYAIVSSTGSFSSTGTLSVSRPWAAGIAAYRMDTTLPTVTLATPADGGIAPAMPTFEGTSSSENSDSETVTLKLYSGPSISGTPVETIDITRRADGSWSYEHTTPLGDNQYTAQVEQMDAAGNVGLSNTATFTVDTLAPDPPSVMSPSPNPGNETSVAWEFVGEPDGSFECRLTLGAQAIEDWTSCTSPAAYELTDGDGIYTFSVRQLDDAGNVGEAASDDYVLDTGAPEDPVITGPDRDPSNNTDPVWAFTSEPGAITECRLMKGADVLSSFAACTSPVTYPLTDGDGTYTFSVRQIDRAGNTSGVSSDDYTLDTTVPTTTIESGPNGLTNNPTVSFSFSSDDATATFECSLDGGGFSPCASPADYSTLGDGTHTFEVRAVDEAGNVDGSPDTRTFTLDTGAPPLSIDSGPSSPDKDRNVTWTFSSETGATMVCELRRDGAVEVPFQDCSSGSATYALGTDGLYDFVVRASDPAGNTSTASAGYLLDTTAPESSASSTALTSSPTITVGYVHSDSGAGVTEVELWVNSPGSGSYILADTDASVSGSFSYTATDGSGAYKFFTRARDAAGNYEDAPGDYDTQTVLDTDAPTVTIDSAPTDPTSDENLVFTFSSADPTASFACSLTSDGSDAYVPCSSPASYVSPDVTTPYTFKVVGTDAAGNVGPPATWSFMYVEPEPEPTVTPTVEPTVTPTETPTVEPTVTPTVTPTVEPTVEPTVTPTVTPTVEPTETVDPEPTKTAEPEPTRTVTPQPSQTSEPPSGGGGGSTVRVDEPKAPVEPKEPAPEKKEPKKEPRPRSEPEPRDDGDDGGFFPSNAPSDPGNRLAELAELAAEAAKKFAFPLLLAILVIIFLLVQHWIDKKDPKLAMAPVHSNHDLASFK